MTSFAHHFSFEFRVGLRNKGLLLLNYLFPLGFYLMMGLMMIPINPGFGDSIIPSMVIFAVLSSTVLGLPTPLVEAREAGIFRTYKINGVPALSILVIPALTTILHTIIVAAIIVTTAPLLFAAQLPTQWLGFAGVFLLLAFAGSGLGVLIGVISSSSRVVVLWSQLVFLPSMLLGGLMMPSDMLPATLKRVGMLLPTTYAMNAFEGLGRNASVSLDPTWSVGILLAGGILAFGTAIALFNWDSRNRAGRLHPAVAVVAMTPYVLGALLLA